MKFFILSLLSTADVDVKLIIPPGYSKNYSLNEHAKKTSFLLQRIPQMNIGFGHTF